ncbi:Myosin motor domain-containing protein, partial [Haematococcus lacustris]
MSHLASNITDTGEGLTKGSLVWVRSSSPVSWQAGELRGLEGSTAQVWLKATGVVATFEASAILPANPTIQVSVCRRLAGDQPPLITCMPANSRVYRNGAEAVHMMGAAHQHGACASLTTTGRPAPAIQTACRLLQCAQGGGTCVSCWASTCAGRATQGLSPKPEHTSSQQAGRHSLGCVAAVFTSLPHHWLQEAIPDLTHLSYLNEPGILCNLGRRYAEDAIYTFAGPVLIALNPCKALPLYTTEVANTYKGRLPGPPHLPGGRQRLPPHGPGACQPESHRESGAGKTETTKKAMQYFATLAGGTGVEGQVLE